MNSSVRYCTVNSYRFESTVLVGQLLEELHHSSNIPFIIAPPTIRLSHTLHQPRQVGMALWYIGTDQNEGSCQLNSNREDITR